MTHVKFTLVNKTKLDILSTPDRIGHSQDLYCRSQWPRGLRRRSAAARLLRSWVRIPPGAWMSVCCECCVLSDRGLCDGLITRPEESYRLWRIVVCDLETSGMWRPWPALGRGATRGKGGRNVAFSAEIKNEWSYVSTPHTHLQCVDRADFCTVL